VDTGPLDGVKQVHPDKLDSYEERFSEQQVSWRFSSGRVLVVDDGTENRELVTLVLEEVGLHVEGAENGKVGAEMAMGKPFDLILMDMQMPVMDGYAATRLLREKGLTTPIYALTAHAMKGFEQECMSAGCTGYLTKPINIDLLLETVGQVLGGERFEDGAANDETPDSPSEQQAALDDTPIVSTLPMDNPRFAAVVAMFVTRLEEELQSMNDAWETRDFKKLAELAHWMKGAGGTVGFAAFTAPASRLETLAKEEKPEQIESTLLELQELSRRIQPPLQTADSDIGCDSTSAAANAEPLVSQLPNTAAFREIVENFVPRLHHKLDELDRAWNVRDFDELAGLAHWLKGVGGTVGFSAFTHPAATIERSAKEHQHDGIESALAELRQLAARIRISDSHSRIAESNQFVPEV
jgi:CheY-like chemotaxis protein/HPt (histidine-containing phosphotransfer) domain-containing protein